ncbi:MAG: sigma-54-dependent Fis family transcriptional regulator [Spirochaetia bacterium]|nr:sigma-54-dependent Fis family transcriptional regulator [Spirochaetia bacterium]
MRVLVADDEPRLLDSIKDFLGAEGIDVGTAPDGSAARSLVSEEAWDAAVLDIRMPGMDGLALLAWIKEAGYSLPVIMMSAHGDVRDAVEAMRLGACDYLVKPFDPDELVMRLRKAVRERRLLADREASRRPDSEPTRLIGHSPAIQEALRLVDRAAPTPATVLVSGESGTGKEVLARLIHERSGRQGAFVAVNLGAVPETLMESELFGYEKGAFTGASERKQGLFELADGGTLFLDEIGEMPLAMQIKILRAIQERKVTRLGGVKGLPVDARIVAATNRDLEAMVRDGLFREDLYYRVNVVRIRLPPLRERPGDARALAEHFVVSLGPRMGRRGMRLSAEALKAIEAYPFPGNVRELSNLVERALILADGDELTPADFQFGHASDVRTSRDSDTPAGTEEPLPLAEIEKRAILAALRRNGGKREATATELGITRRTLFNKLNEYGYRD